MKYTMYYANSSIILDANHCVVYNFYIQKTKPLSNKNNNVIIKIITCEINVRVHGRGNQEWKN